ncbi:MBL fold metallo-hydrolase [Gallalistipes aquisgranensis]|uniref:MBL fold metallo-hydrolase n=1 Tax=Gallalistipes aquisgranensis TaxID=2779358 RepID=UPI001CF8C8FA|nr:MBL fold metallo-hydrolase [Gallalistipes aquisgranensis]MBE5033840.1 MBL fold metallo-hydrolase [Gallalistipes aquisgranensis]
MSSVLKEVAGTLGYETDSYKTPEGGTLTFVFFAHASLAVGYRTGEAQYAVYVDPVSAYADYGAFPAADVVFVTHEHSDHFDPAAVRALLKADTAIVCNREVERLLGDVTDSGGHPVRVVALSEGGVFDAAPWLSARAVAAYNTTAGRDRFHPRGRDNGYVLTLGGTHVYVAGDTEPTPEMKALKDVDIAFLPVNQPYTMTVAQAVEAARWLRPAVLYPCHYGEVPDVTPVGRIAELLSDQPETQVLVRRME